MRGICTISTSTLTSLAQLRGTVHLQMARHSSFRICSMFLCITDVYCTFTQFWVTIFSIPVCDKRILKDISGIYRRAARSPSSIFYRQSPISDSVSRLLGKKAAGETHIICISLSRLAELRHSVNWNYTVFSGIMNGSYFLGRSSAAARYNCMKQWAQVLSDLTI